MIKWSVRQPSDRCHLAEPTLCHVVPCCSHFFWHKHYLSAYLNDCPAFIWWTGDSCICNLSKSQNGRTRFRNLLWAASGGTFAWVTWRWKPATLTQLAVGNRRQSLFSSPKRRYPIARWQPCDGAQWFLPLISCLPSTLSLTWATGTGWKLSTSHWQNVRALLQKLFGGMGKP